MRPINNFFSVVYIVLITGIIPSCSVNSPRDNLLKSFPPSEYLIEEKRISSHLSRFRIVEKKGKKTHLIFEYDGVNEYLTGNFDKYSNGLLRSRLTYVNGVPSGWSYYFGTNSAFDFAMYHNKSGGIGYQFKRDINGMSYSLLQNSRTIQTMDCVECSTQECIDSLSMNFPALKELDYGLISYCK